MKLRIFETDSAPYELDFNRNRVILGRNPECDVVFDGDRFPMVSGLHAEIRQGNTNTLLIHRSRSNKTLCNGDAVTKTVELRAGDHIRLGFTGPGIELLSLTERES
ncbi:MAG: FHA domain-containing protein, partial [Planctomycetales bacterium]|nr:FHA domain-containing protein [Planctomycetales bacterium]